MGWAKRSDSDLFRPFLTPPANPVQFFWLEMPSKYVPLIVLQVLSSNCTSRGSLRPPKRRPKAKNGQKNGFFWSRPKIVGQRGKNWPSRISPMIGELITVKDTPSKVNRLGRRWIPPTEKNASWPIYKFKSIYIQKKFLTKTKRLKLISNHSMVVSGVYYNLFQGFSGASGGLRSQNFDFLTKKKFLRKCSYLRNQTSHRVGSGVKTTVRPRATCMTLQIKCSYSSFQDRLSFIKHL